MMRYKETGEVHLDFHRTTNGTIAYLRKKYGEAFLDETFRRTARDVYRAIREDLLRGDPEQLIEHWTHFFTRDGGEFEIKRDGDTITLQVTRCPAVSYIQSRDIPVDPCFCRQTVVMNEALAEGTPFEIETRILGNARCEQIIRRKRHDSQ